MQKLIFETGDRNIDVIINDLENKLNIKFMNNNTTNRRSVGYVKKVFDNGINKIEVCFFENFDLNDYKHSMVISAPMNRVIEMCQTIVG